MRPVLVVCFHAEAPAGAGPLVGALAAAKLELAEQHERAFLAAGADEFRLVADPPDGLSFGERLAWEVNAAASRGPLGGLVVLGSGGIPLATVADLRRLVEVASGPGGQALANNRFSADVVAVSRASDLAELPPLPADNALPRWLEEVAGVAVADLRGRWRLAVDVDSPLDLVLLGSPSNAAGHLASEVLAHNLEQVVAVLSDRRAELLVAGRVSTATLRWLERSAACRVRALVEERGLRAASRLAQSGRTTGARPPRSVLAELIDREGPASLADAVGRLADAAVIDSRVLLAHRLGADQSAWPEPEDRFASDLLRPATIADPWLRALTESATRGGILLGGHSLVNGGLRLLWRGRGRKLGRPPGRLQ